MQPTTESDAPRKYRTRVFLLAACVVISGVTGNSLLRAGLRSEHLLLPLAYLKAFAHLAVILGILALISRYIFQLSLLSWADLTYALPITASSYILIAAIGVLALDEHVSPTHWLGILLIIFGVILAGRTPPLTTGGDEE